MAESFRCTLPVFLQSRDPDLVARRGGAGHAQSCRGVGAVECRRPPVRLQFVPEGAAQSVVISAEGLESRAALDDMKIRRQVSDHGCRTTLSRVARVGQRHSDAAPVLRRMRDRDGHRALGFGATGRVSTDRVMGELPWRGRCFEATACRLPVRPSA
jgi:hypothetical protein